MANIGENIRAARIKRGLTQEELATAIDTTKAAISRYELGKREPRNDQLKAIAKALNVSVGYLLGYDDIDTQRILSAFEQKDFRTVEELTELPKGFISSLSSKGVTKFEKLLREKLSGSEILFEDLHYFIKARYGEMTPDEEVSLEELIESFVQLNDDGRIVAICRIKELTEIPKYQNKKPPQE